MFLGDLVVWGSGFVWWLFCLGEVGQPLGSVGSLAVYEWAVSPTHALTTLATWVVFPFSAVQAHRWWRSAPP